MPKNEALVNDTRYSIYSNIEKLGRGRLSPHQFGNILVSNHWMFKVLCAVCAEYSYHYNHIKTKQNHHFIL